MQQWMQQCQTKCEHELLKGARVMVYSQLSGLEDLVFNDFIKDDCIPEGDGQVASGPSSLPDPVVLETEKQMLERNLNEGDVLDALGEYKCDSGMSVEDVCHKNTEGAIDYTQVQYRVVGGCDEVCGKEEECCWPACSQV